MSSFSTQDYIRNIQKHNQISLKPNLNPSQHQKDQRHSLSPNCRGLIVNNNIQSPAKMNQNINNINKNLIYNVNVEECQSPQQILNIKVNKKNNQKGKVIEGDLNFNNNENNPNKQNQINVRQSNFSNANSTINKNNKNPRGIPRKSPMPVPKNYKPNNIFSLQKLLSGNKPIYMPSNILKPKSAFQHKSSNSNNVNMPLNKNTLIKNVNGANPGMTKTFNSFNKFKNKINDRSQSPLIHPGDNKLINQQLLKGVKPRYVSKSPVLGKSSIFNRYKNFGFPNGNMIGSQNFKKMKPQIGNQKRINNVNTIQKKKQTIISGEIMQDQSGISKSNNIGINKNNQSSNQNNNIGITNIHLIKDNKMLQQHKKEIKQTNQMNQMVNNNNDLNTIQKPSISNEDTNNPKNSNLNNNPNNYNNTNINNLNINFNNTNQFNNQIINGSNQNNNNQIINVSNQNNNTNKNNQKNQRSQSQGPVDVLKKKGDSPSNPQPQENEKPKIQKLLLSDVSKPIIKKIKDIYSYTHVGFDGEQDKENNQDNFFIFKNFAGHKDYIYMSVCDGHGVEGHFVSGFVKEVLPLDMSENLKHRNILTDTEIIHQIITETFIIVNDKLVDNEEINSLFSGSTCVSVIYTPEKLIVPNIGDSRAVLARFDKATGKYKPIELSRDHKPTEPDEAQRIKENDGRIQPFLEEGEFVGPERVWIKDEEVPGLAMTRSFGDRVAATVGVMSEPEIKEFTFTNDDKFMLIASDGIWEFMTNQEVIDIIKKFYEENDMKGCCDYLYQESSKRWIKEEEVIDDITMILVFFE